MFALFLYHAVTTVTEATINITTSGSFNYIPLPTTSTFNIRDQHWITFHQRGTGQAFVGLQTFYEYTVQPQLVEVYFGWESNKRVGIRRMGGEGLIDAGPVHVGNPLLSETEIRPFWVSWQGGYISGGTGTEVGKNVEVVTESVFPFPVNHVSVACKFDVTMEWLIDDTVPVVNRRLRFQLITPKGLFIPEPQGLSNSTLSHQRSGCLDACADLIWCRGFSYNGALQECRIFDFVSADGNMSPAVTGWETWSLFF